MWHKREFRRPSGIVQTFLISEAGRFYSCEECVDVGQSLPYLLPGFVDSHCHILPTGLDLLKLDLGPAESPEQVLEMVANCHTTGEDSGWLHAVQYDQTKFPGGVHLTRDDLDKISATRPILLRHSNGHASVANSAALESAGVTSDVSDPKGGTYVRDSSGHLTGVLLERAHEHVTGKSPEPTQEEMVTAILRAGDEMSRFGITAATDMMTGRWNLERELLAYRAAAASGCKVRLRLCLQWATVFGARKLTPSLLTDVVSSLDPNTVKIIGAKIFADGAIGSATAAIYSTFRTTGQSGQLIYDPEKLSKMVLTATAADWNVAVHAIGDRATDVVLDAFEASGQPERHRLEHAMILSDSQIDRITKAGCVVTMQPEFLTRFGHAYRAQLQPEIFPHLKRANSCLKAGIPMAFNSDRPIVLGDPWVGIHTAASRPQGFNQSENVSLEQALELYTSAGAQANGDQDQGQLSEGNLADFQIYDGDPFATGRLQEVYMNGSKSFQHTN